MRYVAGYLVKAIKKKILKSANPLKEDLILCLSEMTVVELDCEDHQGQLPDISEDWTRLVDRGGLKHITHQAFQVILAMEKSIRQVFNIEAAFRNQEGLRGQLLHQLQADEDVLYHWSVVAADWEDKVGDELLVMIAGQLVTVRGFSFTSAWLEKYKQFTKTSI